MGQRWSIRYGFGEKKSLCVCTAALESGRGEGRECHSEARTKMRRDWSLEQTRRDFMDGIARELGIESPEGWKRVTSATLVKRGGQGLLQRYGNSVHRILEEVVYGKRLDPLQCRKRVPNGYWEKKENKRAFLERLAASKGVKKPSDWQKITLDDVRDCGGGGLLQQYNSSIHAALRDAFGEEMAQEMRPVRPHGYWKDPSNRRAFLDAIAKEFSVRRPEDWTRVKPQDIRDKGGASLLVLHRNSFFHLLEATYPEHRFDPRTCMSTLPRGYWTSQKSRREFMDDVAKKFNVESPADWTRVKTKDVEDMGGSGLLAKYNGSLFKTLEATYPELDLDVVACRGVLPNYYWDEAKNRRKFLQGFAERHGIKGADDWKNFTWADVGDEGGHGLLKRFSNLFEAIRDAFPEYGLTDDDILRCRTQVPPGHWEKPENVVSALKEAATKLNISKTEDWYRVSVAQLSEVGCGGLFKRMKLIDALRLAYPEEDWNEKELSSRSKRAMQRQMTRLVERMFPHLDMVEDYKHTSLGQHHELAGREYLLELDLYIPGHEIGFEYNGAHHYRDVGFYGPVDMYKRRDEAKRRMCVDRGIRLVEVPYWWDGQVESLAATLYQQLPSFVSTELAADNIIGRKKGDEMLGTQLDREKLLKELERGDHAPIVSLAEHMADEKQRHLQQVTRKAAKKGARVWTPGEQEVEGMIMIEAIDGVRVYWNASEAVLATERGKRLLTAPSWWLDRLPAERDVDGLLYMGKSSIGSLIGAAFLGHHRPDDIGGADDVRDRAWESIRFIALDTPPQDPSQGFAERVELLKALPESDTFVIGKYELCNGTEHLLERLERDIDAGGGGFLLRHSDARYAYGKQAEAELRALKTFTADVTFEAKNTASRSFTCRSPSGARQAVQVSKWEYQQPPAPGTILRVQHFGDRINSGRLKWPYLLSGDI